MTTLELLHAAKDGFWYKPATELVPLAIAEIEKLAAKASVWENWYKSGEVVGAIEQQATISRLITIETAAKTVIRLLHDWATPDILGVRMREALAKLESSVKEGK